MAKPKPDSHKKLEINRKQSKKRVKQLRSLNKDNGGENLSGPINEEVSKDLSKLLEYRLEFNPNESKIGVVRWAIQHTANILRKEGKIK